MCVGFSDRPPPIYLYMNLFIFYVFFFFLNGYGVFYRIPSSLAPSSVSIAKSKYLSVLFVLMAGEDCSQNFDSLVGSWMFSLCFFLPSLSSSHRAFLSSFCLISPIEAIGLKYSCKLSVFKLSLSCSLCSHLLGYFLGIFKLRVDIVSFSDSFRSILGSSVSSLSLHHGSSPAWFCLLATKPCGRAGVGQKFERLLAGIRCFLLQLWILGNFYLPGYPESIICTNFICSSSCSLLFWRK